MDSDLNNQDDHWELSLDIDDSDLRLTPAFRPSSGTQVFILGSDGALMPTQEYMQKVVKDVGEDEDINSGEWNKYRVDGAYCRRHTIGTVIRSYGLRGGGDFIFEEIEACLTNDSIPPGIDDDDFDPKGDLLLLEKLLNDDPSSPLPPKELHVKELKIIKSYIDDPPELELKDLPSHLEYAFLEGTDKLPVIIAKTLKEDEEVQLLKTKRRPPSLALMGRLPTDTCLSAYVMLRARSKEAQMMQRMTFLAPDTLAIQKQSLGNDCVAIIKGYDGFKEAQDDLKGQD
ncbi:hypothetical protein Tco_0110202 [Tanacetum coccineum]